MARHQKHTSIVNNIQLVTNGTSRSTVNKPITSVDLNHSIVFHASKSAHGRLNANCSAGLTSSTNLRLYNDGGTESEVNDGDSSSYVVEYKNG
jgi:hypothetical protein